jgi:hypothetical protein
MPQLSAAEWELARGLYERPTIERIAAVFNVHERTLRYRAKKEGWERQPLPNRPSEGATPALFSPDELGAEGALADLPDGRQMTLEDVRKRLAEVMPRLLGKAVVLAERGVLDKARIDALLSMGRLLEQSEAVVQASAAEQQKRSDDELAAMLERIDERIIELAQAYAERLGGAEHRDEAG